MKTVFPSKSREEIPNNNLYLDQVLLLLIKSVLQFLQIRRKGLTASMVNNHVKHGYFDKT